MAPSSQEIRIYLTGIVKMARGDATGLNHLDVSMRGFWRSFWVLPLCLPAFAMFWIADRNALVADHPDMETGFGFFVKVALTDLAGILLSLLAVAVLARPLNMTDRFVQWVIAGNWLSLPLAYFMAAVTWLSVKMPGPEGADLPFLLIAIGTALFASYRVSKVALNGDGMLAFGLLIMTELIFMLSTIMLG